MSGSCSLDGVAKVAAATPIGTGLLTPWGVLDPSRLSDAGRVDALVALQRMHAWVEAQEQRLLAAVIDTDDELTRDLAAVEIGCALRQPPATVHDRLHAATELVHRLPGTLGLLESGAITFRHARALVDAITPLPDEVATQVEARVLPKAPTQSVAAFRAAVQRAVLALDPRGAEQRHADAMDARRVCARPIGDGMGELWALLPVDGLAQVMAALNAMAAGKLPGDERTTDQRRADALVALAGGAGLDQRLPAAHGRRPDVQVTVGVTTLLGLDDNPGELDGFGPIPAALARALAFDPTGSWRRLLTDPVSGALLDYGQERYRPPRPLADAVIARDRRCRFPGCARAARQCDIDHRIPFGRPGGYTAADNLECLCEHHHRLKHQGGWRVDGDPNGELRWTSPTGHTYRSPPGEYP